MTAGGLCLSNCARFVHITETYNLLNGGLTSHVVLFTRSRGSRLGSVFRDYSTQF